jgi:alpha-tubulin suppressor-like RCC1 family protein
MIMPFSRNRSTSNGSIFCCILLSAILLVMPISPAARAAPFADDVTPAATDAVTLLVPLTGIAAVSADGYHTCALTTGGGVKCWGYSGSGQLGDGTVTNRSTPIDVIGLAAGIATVGTGRDHTCVVSTGGGVKCWGNNAHGQLGDGSTTNHHTPADVTDLTSGVAAVSANYYHTCALTTGGGVKCWGDNAYGQLGIGPVPDSDTPVDVTGLASGVAAVSAGAHHTCALTNGGGVKCWGENDYGQLGDDSTTDRFTPVDVTGLTAGVAAVSAGGEYTCALTTGGGVKCWGRNGFGQLGNGPAPDSDTPVDVTGLTSGVAAVSAGFDHTCAQTTGGGVKCWGRNYYGQLGDGTTTDRFTPVDVTGLASGVAAVSASRDHTCVVTISGGVKCWGYNLHGQLGDTTQSNRSLPGDVLVLATCYALSRTHTGGGDDPTAMPTNTPACPQGHYLADAAVVVMAAPAAGHYVQSWSATVNNISRDLSNLVLMPAADTTVGVAYGVCRALTLAHTGAGVSPVAAPGASAGCPAGSYAAGEKLTLTADADAGSFVSSWTGADNDGNAGSNSLTMPDVDHSVEVAYSPCRTLTRSHTGSGDDPIAVPGASAGCPAGTYAAGEKVTLTAHPDDGFFVASWTDVDNDGSAAFNSLTLPDADAKVSVAYAPCRTLTLTHTGSGDDPIAVPHQSTGCPAGTYAAGEMLALTACSHSGSYIADWSGADIGGISLFNSLTVPNADHTVSVSYRVCRTLTLAHAGTGANPFAVPNASDGCPVGTYAPGEAITLIAAPGTDQRVKSWTNAAQTPAAGVLVNSVTMSDADCGISVAYEACFQLTATTSGQGEPIAASPVASYGCAPGMYVAGQSIVLSAAPATGWAIAGWSGTANDAATAGTNTLTMPAAAKIVGITYAEATTPGVFLPSLSR